MRCRASRQGRRARADALHEAAPLRVPRLHVRNPRQLHGGVDGKEYLDAMASLWYCAIGHGRKEMADAAT